MTKKELITALDAMNVFDDEEIKFIGKSGKEYRFNGCFIYNDDTGPISSSHLVILIREKEDD